MRYLLRLLVAAGLAVDAYIHADLAGRYNAIGTSFTQGDLFRIEAGVASFAALLVIVWGGRVAYGLAFLVAASALGAVVLYRYDNVGKLAFLPNMYEPRWFTEKAEAAIAEGVALAGALMALGAVGVKRLHGAGALA
ncbi:MAG: hypothetical protein ACRDYC_07370 [Acidimicrobiales bacterium]